MCEWGNDGQQTGEFDRVRCSHLPDQIDRHLTQSGRAERSSSDALVLALDDPRWSDLSHTYAAASDTQAGDLARDDEVLDVDALFLGVLSSGGGLASGGGLGGPADEGE